MGRCGHAAGVVAGGVAALAVCSALATLFSVITASSVPTSGVSCLRRCTERDTRICSFTLTVHLYQTLSRACGDCPSNSSDCSRPHCVSGDGIKRLITVADHQLPGPAIHVCEGDEIRVEVHNKLPSAGVSLHWHGLSPSPFMDGTPGLAQSLLPPRQVFTYSIPADNPGTHYWHALAGFQSGDGVFGPLVVHQSKSREPHSELYDHDLPEHVIVVHDWLHVPTAEQFTLHHHSGADHYPQAILVNGKGAYTKEGRTPDSERAPLAEFLVREGERYRMRVVSAAFTNCPIVWSVARHLLTVIATDGVPMVPYNATHIVLHPGERWDVVLRADQQPSSYWMEFEGELDCQTNGVRQRAVLHYLPRHARSPHPDRSVTPLQHAPNMQRHTVNPVQGSCSADGSTGCLTSLRSSAPLPSPLAVEAAATTLYLEFSLRYLDHPDYYHPQLYSIADESEIGRIPSPQVNNITYRGLPTTLMLLETPPSDDKLCNADSRSAAHCRHELCQCLHLHALPLGQVVDLVLIDAGGTLNQGQTVHLHGHSFRVLSQGKMPPVGPEGQNRARVMALDAAGAIQRNLEQPIQKDTVMIPANGYTVVRFKADNPGYWLLQSQVLFHWWSGMAVVLRVGEPSDFPAPPDNVNRCPV